MNGNIFFRALPLAALLMLWVAGSGLWAQGSIPALPNAAFQPANPDAPLPNDAPAAAQPGTGASEGAPEAPAQAGTEPASESAAQQAEAPAQAGTEPASESAAQQAEAPAQAGTEPASESAAQQAGAPGEDKPWSRSELANIYQPHPTAVRVAVLDASGRTRGAALITYLLEEYRRKELERKIGKLISVVNQSSLMDTRLKNSIISYRPGNLRAALIMAEVIPGRQYVKPMVSESTPKIGVDVEIRVGMELP